MKSSIQLWNLRLSLTDTTPFEPLLTDAEEIHYILKNFKNEKFNGADSISNIVQKKLPKVVHEFLANSKSHTEHRLLS